MYIQSVIYLTFVGYITCEVKLEPNEPGKYFSSLFYNKCEKRSIKFIDKICFMNISSHSKIGITPFFDFFGEILNFVTPKRLILTRSLTYLTRSVLYFSGCYCVLDELLWVVTCSLIKIKK